jgi:hypothetical protein
MGLLFQLMEFLFHLMELFFHLMESLGKQGLLGQSLKQYFKWE